MNIFATNAASLLQIAIGEKVSIINPFCKKAGDSKSDSKSEIIDYASAESIQISAVCTSVFDFKNPSFISEIVEANFKNYVFANSLRLDLFTDQFYTPPKA